MDPNHGPLFEAWVKQATAVHLAGNPSGLVWVIEVEADASSAALGSSCLFTVLRVTASVRLEWTSMPYLGPNNIMHSSMLPTGRQHDNNNNDDVCKEGRSHHAHARLQDVGSPGGQAERLRRLTAKNRRKRYLDVHPEYFEDQSLELADPLLYDRLIRRFQTAAEREAEGRRKGFSGQMATDMWRVEAKKDALSNPDPASLFTYTRGPQGEIRAADKDDAPMSKEEGVAWWRDEMTMRFLRGGDVDFDYHAVDTNDRYDDPEEERDRQDAYFDSMESDFDTDGEGKEKVLTGETGIQDY